MVPLMILSVSLDANAGATGIKLSKMSIAPHFDHLYPWSTVMPFNAIGIMVLPMVSHDQKSDVAPNLDLLHLMNAEVPLMMPSALHYANASANGIT